MAADSKALAELAGSHRDGLFRMIRAEYVAAGHSDPRDKETSPTDEEIRAALVAEFAKKETV